VKTRGPDVVSAISERTSLRVQPGRGTPGGEWARPKTGAIGAPTGAGRERPCPTPARPVPYADPRTVWLMTSSALSAASCSERRERCA
jgi:hypothetical protein